MGISQCRAPNSIWQNSTLNANRPITAPLGDERPWGKRLDGHLIVLGLSFLEGLKMTVDIDEDKVWFEDR